MSPALLRRVLVFMTVFSVFLMGTTAFVEATWIYFFGDRPGDAWKLAPALLALAFAPATLIGFRHSSWALRFVYGLSALWLGFLSFGFFAAIACWIVFGATRVGGWPIERAWIAEFFFGLALAATVCGFLNAAWIRVTRVTVKLPGLPAAWHGRRAALLTDLHLGHISGARYLRRILTVLRRLQPDIVLISGDMFDGTQAGVNGLVAPWREYTAPLGIYFVTGNHEEMADPCIYIDAIKRVGIRVLAQEKLIIDGLQLVGIHDSAARDPRTLRAFLKEMHLDRDVASILLAHQPANLAVVEEEGVSLQLSGHTHGGQFWPWSLLVSRIYGKFARGLQRLGKLQIYISNGMGTWGPPLRVGTKSELVLIRFENAAD